jgi:hypothetical protein
MSSEIPKKPSSGNHVFVVMTIVMLLATGGLILWKFVGSSSTEQIATATSAPGDYERRAENPLPPPPPPPPPELPSAAPTAGAPVNPPAHSGKAPCSGACNGEVTAALKSALAGRGGSGRRCYEKSLAQNALLRGRMTMHVRVGANGSVCSANVTNDELRDPGLSNCIIGVFRSSLLPAPDKGCVEVDVPLNFVPNK